MKVWQGPDDTADAKNDSEKRGIDGEGYRVYDKNYGRGFVGREDVRGAFEEFLCVKRAEVTRGLGEKVARRLREEVRGMERVLAGEESRMFSASILFVYEGDGEVLARGLEEEESEGRRCDGDKGDEEVDEEDEEGDDDDDDDDDDVEGPHIAVAKLIDFAHASWTPGQGPDENALQGVRNVLSILTDLSAS